MFQWDPNKYCSLTTYKGHDRLVYEAKWSPFLSSCFASVSGTHFIFYFSVFIDLILAHSGRLKYVFYNVSVCPLNEKGDGMLDIWDCSSPLRPSAKVNAHQAEVLCCSWNMFQPFVLATGGSEGLVRVWDARKLLTPVFQLEVSTV